MTRPPTPRRPPRIRPAVDPAEARRLDGRILDLRNRHRLRSLAICHDLWALRQGGHEALGFASFDAYLEARQIRRSWAYFMAGVYQKLTVDLGIPEREWLGIPLSRLQGVLKRITPLTWRPLLRDARAMSRRRFRKHLRNLQGRGMNLARGSYRLEAAERPGRVEADTALSVRLRVFQDGEGRWIASHYPVAVGPIGGRGPGAGRGIVSHD